MTADLTNPIFNDENAARQYLEAQRWPEGPFCPYCGQFDTVSPFKGKSMGPGWHHCNSCRKKFTVRVGTLYERSHIPLHKWLLATHLICSSKKGISAHQLHRMLGITYKSAWFMAHRIREGMRDDKPAPVGGGGKMVEADETYFGNKDRVIKRTKKGKPSHGSKRSVFALVERGGKARMFHVEHATAANLREILVTNVPRETALLTDESRLYTVTGKEYAAHETVNHSAGEYVRGVIHTNTVENVFSVFKRGMKGVYQHCGEAHLFRYLAEFEFRYNSRSALGFTDKDRALMALKGIEGKRLTYRRTNEAAFA